MEFGHLSDHPHYSTVSSAYDEYNWCVGFDLTSKLLEAVVPLLLVSHVVKIDINGDQMVFIFRPLRSRHTEVELFGLELDRWVHWIQAVLCPHLPLSRS